MTLILIIFVSYLIARAGVISDLFNEVQGL